MLELLKWIAMAGVLIVGVALTLVGGLCAGISVLDPYFASSEIFVLGVVGFCTGIGLVVAAVLFVRRKRRAYRSAASADGRDGGTGA